MPRASAAALIHCCSAVVGADKSFGLLLMTCTLNLYPNYLLSSTGPTTAMAVELVRKAVPVYQPKSGKTNYQSPFTQNEYLQQMLRVALPGRPRHLCVRPSFFGEEAGGKMLPAP